MAKLPWKEKSARRRAGYFLAWTFLVRHFSRHIYGNMVVRIGLLAYMTLDISAKRSCDLFLLAGRMSMFAGKVIARDRRG
jgi:hypothetical protein